MSTLDRTDAPVANEYATVHVAFELSKKTWKLGVLLPGSKSDKGWMDLYLSGDEFAAYLKEENARIADTLKSIGLVQ